MKGPEEDAERGGAETRSALLVMLQPWSGSGEGREVVIRNGGGFRTVAQIEDFANEGATERMRVAALFAVRRKKTQR